MHHGYAQPWRLREQEQAQETQVRGEPMPQAEGLQPGVAGLRPGLGMRLGQALPTVDDDAAPLLLTPAVQASVTATSSMPRRQRWWLTCVRKEYPTICCSLCWDPDLDSSQGMACRRPLHSSKQQPTTDTTATTATTTSNLITTHSTTHTTPCLSFMPLRHAAPLHLAHTTLPAAPARHAQLHRQLEAAPAFTGSQVGV